MRDERLENRKRAALSKLFPFVVAFGFSFGCRFSYAVDKISDSVPNKVNYLL